jgi:predicted DNA binding CopG/RHH family protein
MNSTKRKVALEPEEQRLLNDFESGRLVPVADPNEAQQARAAARKALLKDQRINIRLTTADLRSLQAIALEEGLPYQSLITSILHKYVTGRLIDQKTQVRERRR